MLALALWIPAACAQPANAPDSAPVAGILEMESASEALRQVEAELMAAEGRTVEFHVISEGAFSASLEGQLVLTRGDDLSMDASGTFGPDSATLRVQGSGGRMTWGNRETSAEDDLPPALREAVVIGLVRMGVLHNLARLVSGAPPDRTDGTVRTWVDVEDVTWEPARAGEDGRGIRFGIVVAGQRTADATVWLDAGGRLVGRDQVVRFPGGEMQVTERYLSR